MICFKPRWNNNSFGIEDRQVRSTVPRPGRKHVNNVEKQIVVTANYDH